MEKVKLALIFTLLVGVVLSACQPDAPVDGDYAFGQDATVESLEVLLLESFPLGARVVVSGYLPDGCTELDQITVERQGREFVLTLVTRRPTGDVMCTMALEYFEETVDLDIESLEAGTYTVVAQDQEAAFTLDVDNVLQLDPLLGDGDVVLSSDAVVEEMSVMIMESYPVQVSVRLAGYLPDGCTSIREVRSSRDGNIFTIQVVTQRPDGDMACTMAIVPFEENIALEVVGLPAGVYTVQLSGLRETFTLEMDN